MFATMILPAGALLGAGGIELRTEVDWKFDPDLRRALGEAEGEHNGADKAFRVFVLMKQGIDREALVRATLEVRTMAGDMATASGTAAALRRAAALEAVTFIALSGTAYPQQAGIDRAPS